MASNPELTGVAHNFKMKRKISDQVNPRCCHGKSYATCDGTCTDTTGCKVPDRASERALCAIECLDLTVKNSIVDLLISVETGYISKRRAATEIMRAYNERTKNN